MDALELKDVREWGRSQQLDTPIELIFRPGAPWRRWIKADGTLTSTPLPCDPYHILKYRQRGWTIGPLKDAPVVHKDLAATHRHTFKGRAKGSPCTDSRCQAARSKKQGKRRATSRS
jgi:hypothetical protein